MTLFNDILKTVSPALPAAWVGGIAAEEAGIIDVPWWKKGQGPELPDIPILRELQDAAETAAETGKALVLLLASLLLPHRHSIRQRKIETYWVPEIYHYENDYSRPIYADEVYNPSGLSGRFDHTVTHTIIGYHKKKVIDREGYYAQRTFAGKEDFWASFWKTQKECFKIYSSIPLLQFIGLMAGTAATIHYGPRWLDSVGAWYDRLEQQPIATKKVRMW